MRYNRVWLYCRIFDHNVSNYCPQIFNAEVLFREDATADQFIDVIQGNRKYMNCLYVYNKIDQVHFFTFS